MSERVSTLPRLFDILASPRSMRLLCSQMRTNGFLPDDSDCAISHSWCGKMLSSPPVWISICSPKCLRLIAEHSMCHPGNPDFGSSPEELEIFPVANSHRKM